MSDDAVALKQRDGSEPCQRYGHLHLGLALTTDASGCDSAFESAKHLVPRLHAPVLRAGIRRTHYVASCFAWCGERQLLSVAPPR